MLTIKRIKEQTEDVLRLLQKKHFEAREYISEVLDLDELRRRTQQELDASLAQQNAIAKEIGALMKQGLKDQAEKIRTQVADLKQLSRQLEEKKNEAEARIREILLQIPNLPAEIVPEGATAEDNVCVKMGGHNPELPLGAGEDLRPHRLRARRQDHGRGLPRLQGLWGTPAARAHQLLPRQCP